MTQLIVLAFIVLGNVVLGVLAKRHKELARKRREAERAAGRDPGAVSERADEDEGDGFLDMILREAERRAQVETKAPPTAATTSAPPTSLPTPTPTPTARMGVPPPMPTPSAPNPTRGGGGDVARPRPQPAMRAPAPRQPETQRRPQQPVATGRSGASGTGKTAPRPLGALSTRTESPGAKRRRLEHAARVKERAARKLARQEWSRARKARTTTRVSKLTPTAATLKSRAEAAKRVPVVHPVIAAIREVFRNRASLQAAFLVGDILQRRESSDGQRGP